MVVLITSNLIFCLLFLASLRVFGFTAIAGYAFLLSLIIYPFLSFIYEKLWGRTMGSKNDDTLLFNIVLGFTESGLNKKKMTSITYLVWFLSGIIVLIMVNCF